MSGHAPPGTPFLHLAADRDGEPDDEGDADVWPVVGSLLIGREEADITLALPGLSRRHASVRADGHGVRIVDLGSTNGTAVNGTVLANDAHALRHGDRIVLAGSVELRFHDPQATPVAPRLGRLRGLWIDDRTRDVWIDAEKLAPPLSARQQDLLELLVAEDGRTLDRAELIERLWPNRTLDTLSTDAVDSLVKRLRRRLASIEHGDPVLEVRRGHGVRFRQER